MKVEKKERLTNEELMFLKALHYSGAFRKKKDKKKEGFIYLVKFY